MGMKVKSGERTFFGGAYTSEPEKLKGAELALYDRHWYFVFCTGTHFSPSFRMCFGDVYLDAVIFFDRKASMASLSAGKISVIRSSIIRIN